MVFEVQFCVRMNIDAYRHAKLHDSGPDTEKHLVNIPYFAGFCGFQKQNLRPIYDRFCYNLSYYDGIGRNRENN